MAKKSDILSLYENDFPKFYTSYNSRLRSLEREFLDVKNFQHESIQNAIKEYEKIESDLQKKFIEIERKHFDRKLEIEDMYRDRFTFLDHEIITHNDKTEELINAENEKFQEILNQFEERKSEAFDTYLRLTKENNYAIEHENQIHRDFINTETAKLDKIKESYQKLNSDLSNQLLWTMERAKNSLEKLNNNLKGKTANDIEFMNDTIFESLKHLRMSHEKLSNVFADTTHKLEKERNYVREISIDKRKPHSEINQEMIQDFVKKIRDINQRRVAFEQMINQELNNSLELIYPKIIQSDADKDDEKLHKFILQKEIIEKKAKYLLNRNQTISDSLISKYQNEIKKIKIDSFKRYEEIKLAYEMPASFFQNSVNIYSNFNFYLNEAFNDLDNILMDLIKYNQNYIKIKSDYITGSSKVVEDYKINLMVRVNDLTVKLTNYISKIDEISNQIVTLESNNRLEIAEVKKKMENLEIEGDLNKYMAALENDQYLALFQHNKNIEKIQLEANYKSDLLHINSEVLLMNKNKHDLEEYRKYLLEVLDLENEIKATTFKKKIAEASVYYEQQKQLSDITMQLLKARLSFDIKKKNYGFASKYYNLLESDKNKNSAGSDHIVDFVHEMQTLIDLNTRETNQIKKYVASSDEARAYSYSLEKNREKIIQEVKDQTKKKTKICFKAIELYNEENKKLYEKTSKVLEKYQTMIKQLILFNEAKDSLDKDYIVKSNGNLSEILASIKYVYSVVNEYAYKYQIPSVIKTLKTKYDCIIEKLVFLNIKQINIISRTKSPVKITKALNKYYIESLNMLKKIEKIVDKAFIEIKERVTKNDHLFLNKALKHEKKILYIIDSEYDRLILKSTKRKANREKQISEFVEESENLNNVFKDNVQKINKEFLKTRKENKEVSDFVKKEFTKIIDRNNKELINLLKFIDKLYLKDTFELQKQYKEYIKSFDKINLNQKVDYEDEINFINQLYNSRMDETDKTIAILEKRIDELPVKKQDAYQVMAKERQELNDKKQSELMKIYTEIEKQKFISRPAYLKQIEAIEKRLPDDYVDLYKKIQFLEDDFIKQYSNINSDYFINYQRFLKSQLEYKDVITKHALIYKPFEDMKKYHDDVLNSTDILYKDTLTKSKDARDKMNKAKQKSKEKQDRIINA